MNKKGNKLSNIFLIILIVLISLYGLLRLTNIVEIYRVETGSMEDNIHTGDYISIIKQKDYKVGDVVTYKVNGYHITHRIVSIDGDKVITKGDANNIEDEAITKDEIIGKVILSGGILNFIVGYKFVIVGILICLYLITCFMEMEKSSINSSNEVKKTSVKTKNNNVKKNTNKTKTNSTKGKTNTKKNK